MGIPSFSIKTAFLMERRDIIRRQNIIFEDFMIHEVDINRLLEHCI